MESFKFFCRIVNIIFSGMCWGYITYALVTFIYCKYWRKDVPWFNKLDFFHFNKYWVWIWGICIIPALIDAYFQFRK